MGDSKVKENITYNLTLYTLLNTCELLCDLLFILWTWRAQESKRHLEAQMDQNSRVKGPE